MTVASELYHQLTPIAQRDGKGLVLPYGQWIKLHQPIRDEHLENVFAVSRNNSKCKYKYKDGSYLFATEVNTRGVVSSIKISTK